MGLVDNFRDKVSKIKNTSSKEADFDVLYSTGFLSIDFLNGTTVHVDTPERQFTYVAGGIVDGSTNCFIGRAGSGKSTLTTMIAGNILKQFIKLGLDTGLFIDDIEGSLPQPRKEFLLGLTPQELEEYVSIRNVGITSENVFTRIKLISDEKKGNRKKYEYDTGLYDTYGNRIYKLVPTIYMIDSLPMLLPDDLAEDEELGGSMDASSIAKKNTMLMKKISQLCKEANIILFTINHILDDINMGFAKKAAQISGLKEGERLPGGKAAIYLANNMFRTDDSITLKRDKDYGIDGSIVILTLIKSRTNASKRSVPLIFNKTEGRFDPILSLFHLLKTEGIFKGAGAYQYLEGAEEYKFGPRTFKEVLNNSEELQKVFAKTCYDVLSTYLSDTRTQSADTQNTVDNINSMILGFGNQ